MRLLPTAVLSIMLLPAQAEARKDKLAPSEDAPIQPAQAVDPLGDPSFNAALPPLDSIAAPATPVDAAPAPGTPSNDPALTQPLPPLAGFDPTPDTSKASVPSTEDTRIRYTLALDGLDKIGVVADFKSFSSLEKGKKKAANASQVTARAAEDVQLAERLMRAQGYYDGIATSTVLPVKDQPGVVAVTISATPGLRYDFGGISITGADPEPTQIALDALPPTVATGKPIVATEVEGGEASVALALPQKGYPFAKVGQRDILLDDQSHRGDYTLPIDAGHKGRFGKLTTKGDKVFNLKHLGIFPRFRPGDVYDSNKADDLRQALVATSLFSSIAVAPVGTGILNPDGTEIVDLDITQQKGPWHQWAGSAGYGTGEGIKAQASWTDRNLSSPEGALILSAIGGTQEQGASTTFRRSNAGQRDKSFQVQLSADRTNYDAYEANTLDLSVNWARQSTPLWQKVWTYSYGAEVIGTNEQGAATSPTGDRPRRNYLIGALPVQVQYDRSDDLLNPTKGYRVLARVSPEASLHGGVKGYGRLTGQVTGYYPITKSIVLAGRAMVNSIVGISDLDEIAPSRRIYAGGGGSVRGFGYQELGPKDLQNNPIGGLTSTEFAIEARYRFGNFGIVPFFDAGRVGEKSMPGIGGLREGVGIGGRYYTNFGPMRLDIATPINRQPGESKIALYISIGQAF